MSGTGPIAGFVMHFMIGSVILALVYALILFRFLPGAPWLRGLLSGVIFWLALELLMMPMP